MLTLHAVEVRLGAVVRCFPFDGELQSMRLVDKLLLCDRKLPATVQCLDDALCDELPELSNAVLYEVIPLDNQSAPLSSRSDETSAGGFLLIPLSDFQHIR